MAEALQLAVLYDGHRVGHVEVTHRDARRICGSFIPEGEYDCCKGAFEAVARWSALCELAADDGDAYSPAKDRWAEAVESLTSRVRLPEVAQRIEEFNVDEDREVEIFLFAPEAAPSAVNDR